MNKIEFHGYWDMKFLYLFQEMESASLEFDIMPCTSGGRPIGDRVRCFGSCLLTIEQTEKLFNTLPNGSISHYWNVTSGENHLTHVSPVYTAKAHFDL